MLRRKSVEVKKAIVKCVNIPLAGQLVRAARLACGNLIEWVGVGLVGMWVAALARWLVSVWQP